MDSKESDMDVSTLSCLMHPSQLHVYADPLAVQVTPALFSASETLKHSLQHPVITHQDIFGNLRALHSRVEVAIPFIHILHSASGLAADHGS